MLHLWVHYLMRVLKSRYYLKLADQVIRDEV